MINNNNVKPLVFLTNDDGVDSPGLHALAAAIQPFADLRIIAPSNQMTATGRGLYGDRDSKLEPVDLTINDQTITAYHAPCSPAHVVMQGIKILGAQRLPDLLISGINYGENMGRDISMSGTVGAAIQAVCMGVPSMAVSLQTAIDYHFKYGDVDWDVAAFFAEKFAQLILDRKLPADVDILKVDVPQNAENTTEWRVTQLERQSYFQANIESPTLDSCLNDTDVTVSIDLDSLDTTSDVYALHVDKVVSVTPISLDFTSRVDLSLLQTYFK